MNHLSDLVGAWTGTNGFRLMPDDPLAEFAAAATVTVAGGSLNSIAYSWEHPDDGPQDGLLVFGQGEDDDALFALWGDSWHQQPAPMMLSGRRSPGTDLEFEGTYARDFSWRILLAATGENAMRMRMDNVVPQQMGSV